MILSEEKKKYRREWIRKWRENPENRAKEKEALQKSRKKIARLKAFQKEKTITIGQLMELWIDVSLRKEVLQRDKYHAIFEREWQKVLKEPSDSRAYKDFLLKEIKLED